MFQGILSSLSSAQQSEVAGVKEEIAPCTDTRALRLAKEWSRNAWPARHWGPNNRRECQKCILRSTDHSPNSLGVTLDDPLAEQAHRGLSRALKFPFLQLAGCCFLCKLIQVFNHWQALECRHTSVCMITSRAQPPKSGRIQMTPEGTPFVSLGGYKARQSWVFASSLFRSERL